jgi:hypothetical protein
MPVTINGTTGIAGANGSASTPAVQGEDTNTGVFFPAADTVAVATGGSERMRVDSSGNVGVGTTSPGSVLEIFSPASALTTGNLALNTSSTTGASRISFKESGSTVGQLAYSHDGNNLELIANESGSGIIFYTSGTNERARINSSGNLLVGTTATLNVFSGTTDGISLEGAGAVVASRNNEAAAYLRRRSTNGQIVAFLRDTTQVGNISVTTTATSYVTSSDYRLKENVQPMQDALAKIAQLNPVTYTWKADGSDGQGFIAHELQAVVPDCVSGEKDAVDAEGNPQYQGVDTSFLVATLVAAIKELKAEVDSLKAQLEAN